MATELERLLENGRQAEQQGNGRQARLHYEAASTLAPDHPIAWLRLGTLCHRMRDYARAEIALEAARRIDPDDAEVSFRLGLTYDALGVPEKAREAYARTAMLAPGSWQTWFLIGRDHRLLGHAEIARLAFRRAMEINSDVPEVLFELGTLLWEIGMQDDAYPMIEQAAQLSPVDAGLRLQLGLVDLERGALSSAQRHLMAAKHLDPDDRRVDQALQELSAKRRSHKRKRVA